ncbi:hypothetical protein [Marinobacter sp.]|uniref:hypothetical protein n=1 Tax=Marinobacter sp. TaxID=50741 RepID=UPI00356623A9
MTDFQHTPSPDSISPERRNRKFSVSANRGKASHKVRYVEAGGAAVDTEECTFCQSVPDLSGDTQAKEKDRSR